MAMNLSRPHARRAPTAVILAAALLAALGGQQASAQATPSALPNAPRAVEIAEPLIMQGKKSLYQRVLARPGAVLHEAPEAAAAKDEVPPFRMFYVYGRRMVGEVEWLRVGNDTRGDLSGWMRGDQTLPWNQALTVAFREPLGHDRVMLFRDKGALKDLVRKHDLIGFRKLYTKAEGGLADPDSPVVAIQPEGHIDIKNNFYLVPIKAHEDLFLAGQRARLLQVTSVPLDVGTASTPPGSDPENASDANAPADGGTSTPSSTAGYRTGLVFVVDSTISMGPYIDRTRAVMEKVYAAIDSAGLTERVSFGLVAYRDNPEAAPGLEYRTRRYVTLAEGMDGKAFLAKTGDVVPASVSSKDFREDAYAGLKEAIDGMDWSGFEGRYVVLITDAGPREGDDPLGSTGLDTTAINQLAQDKKIAIWVMHLKTPYTVADHAYAESRYRAVSKYPGIGDFYYDVGRGDVGEFGGVLTALTAQITRQVGDAAAGVAARKIEESNDAEPDQLSRFQRKVELLGYALRMRYLQRQDNSTVPSVFDAWLVDRDFRDPERASLDVRVLLTREQLSDLQSVLRRVLETAEEGVLAPDTFLSELKSLAAAVSRDPEAVSTSTRAAGAKGNLADLGYMREYIEDLPYTGEIMNLSLEDWEDWPARRQLQFIHRLENRISYYQALHDDTDLWVSLDGGPIDGDSVFPVVLEMLP